MAHEVEKMFYVKETPWHGLGKRFIEAPETVQEAIVAAGLNWQVYMKDLFTTDGEQAPAQATFRNDTNAMLGVVGPSYTPLQNIDAFEFFNPFLQSKEVSFETAGSLREGRKVWILGKINRDNSVIKGNDEVSKYVLLSNSHDGSLAVRVGFTPIRVVCNNTLSMSIDSKDSQLIRLKHGKNVKENLENVREIMNVMDSQFEATAEQYRFLASKEINSDDLEKYIKICLVTNKNTDFEKAGKKLINKVIPLFEHGRGNDMQEIKGTWWAAYNAINEYLVHEKGKDEAARLDNIWFGQSASLNRKALNIAVKMAA